MSKISWLEFRKYRVLHNHIFASNRIAPDPATGLWASPSDLAVGAAYTSKAAERKKEISGAKSLRSEGPAVGPAPSERGRVT